LPSYGLALEPRNISLLLFEERLRKLETPIIARIGHDRLLIDVRTIRKVDEPLLISGIAAALADGT
jgi:L-seryl-tRNA(Ser) seleniumtransferase